MYSNPAPSNWAAAGAEGDPIAGGGLIAGGTEGGPMAVSGPMAGGTEGEHIAGGKREAELTQRPWVYQIRRRALE